MTWTPDDFRRKVGNFKERFYIDQMPADDRWEACPDLCVPAVSTVKGAWPKYLDSWAATSAAEFAFDNKESWQNLARDAAVPMIAKASDRDRDRGGERGTSLHKVAEALGSGREPSPLETMGIEPYVVQLRQFLDDWQPEPLLQEIPLIKRGDLGWGGTGDDVSRFSALGTTFVDYKSRKPGKAGEAYDDEGLQLLAYMETDYYVDLAEGVRKPLPKIDAAVIVAISSDGYHVHEVDLDKARRQWYALRELWESKRGGSSIRGTLLNPIRKGAKAAPAAVEASVAFLEAAGETKAAEQVRDAFDGLTEAAPPVIDAAGEAARLDESLTATGRIVDTEAAVHAAFGPGVETVIDDEAVSLRTLIKQAIGFFADLGQSINPIDAADAAASRATLEQLAATWPEGVPTLKQSEAHTVEQLRAIWDALEAAAKAAHGPFGPTLTSLAAPAPHPAVPEPYNLPAPGTVAEGPSIDQTDYDMLKAAIIKLHTEQPELFGEFHTLQLEAHGAGYAFDIKSMPSTRREAINWALINWLRKVGIDRRNLAIGLGRVHGSDSLVPEHLAPEHLGALTTKAARALSALADDIGAKNAGRSAAA